MPTKFPEWNDAESRFVERDYLTLAEVADLTHLTRQTVRDHVERYSLPHLRIGTRIFLDTDQVRAMVSSWHKGGDDVPEANGLPLGEAMPADDWDQGGPADQDPGGVR